MPLLLPILLMLVWLCWKLPKMGQVNMLTGPKGTLWNMLTLVPITTESTSISEVRILHRVCVCVWMIYIFEGNVIQSQMFLTVFTILCYMKTLNLFFHIANII